MSKNLGFYQPCLLGNATRVPGYPKTRVNPPVFKPVNPGLCASENPGLTGLISGVSTHRMLIIQLVYSFAISVFGRSMAGKNLGFKFF